jgi:peptidoglycan hydrolase CwlO-like protein
MLHAASTAQRESLVATAASPGTRNAINRRAAPAVVRPKTALSLSILLSLTGCTAQESNEDKIADIASDAATDAIAEAAPEEVAGGQLDSRLDDLEQKVTDQEQEISSLQSNLDDANSKISELEARSY